MVCDNCGEECWKSEETQRKCMLNALGEEDDTTS